jgi:hypothetical protein
MRDGVPKATAFWEAFSEPPETASQHAYGPNFSKMADRILNVTNDCVKAFKQVYLPWGGGLKEIKSLGEDPRVSDGGPAYHHRVAPGFPLHPEHIVWPLDVPVAYDWNGNGFFDPGDQGPVRSSPKPLCGGSGMDGYGINAALFCHARYPDRLFS